jgi:hypothetical protein
MATSQNGWPASPSLARRPLIVGGVEFIGGIVDNKDVATILGYVMTRFHHEVEPLHNPGCWGFSYRENRNDPNSLSNHSSGTAVDANAPQHPNGVPTSRTFTAAQIATVHPILDAVDGVVRWGGDYTGTPDSMHFEINSVPVRVAIVAARIRRAQEDDMPYTEKQLTDIVRAAVKAEVEPLLAQNKRIRHAVMGGIRDVRAKVKDADVLAKLDEMQKALEE